MNPPVAKRIPFSHELHGDTREDNYYWLKERTNPEVIQYLEEENQYYDEIMKPQAKSPFITLPSLSSTCASPSIVTPPIV